MFDFLKNKMTNKKGRRTMIQGSHQHAKYDVLTLCTFRPTNRRHILGSPAAIGHTRRLYRTSKVWQYLVTICACLGPIQS